jgi:hypothetical protein
MSSTEMERLGELITALAQVRACRAILGDAPEIVRFATHLDVAKTTLMHLDREIEDQIQCLDPSEG